LYYHSYYYLFKYCIDSRNFPHEIDKNRPARGLRSLQTFFGCFSLNKRKQELFGNYNAICRERDRAVDRAHDHLVKELTKWLSSWRIFHLTTDFMTGSATFIKFMLQNVLSIKRILTCRTITSRVDFFVDNCFSSCNGKNEAILNSFFRIYILECSGTISR